MTRAAYNILIFFSIALFPWPVYSALLLAGVFLFRNFFEAIIWILIIEILFSPVGIGIHHHWYAITLVVLLAASWYAKKVMRWYE